MEGSRKTDSAAGDLAGLQVVVAVGGGIAAYKVVETVRGLMKRGAEVRVMMTRSATRFIHPTTFAAITGRRVGLELFSETGAAEVDHLEMPHWADIVLVAPATADLIAKMAAGIADDLVTTALLAAECPVIVAPAMNSSMYRHPATCENLETLRNRNVVQVGPESGEMASPGEHSGPGRMSEPAELIEAVSRLFHEGGSLSGRKVVITAGRTEEAIDPVRVLTNRSSGRMGVALAEEALRLGASVTLIHGPLEVPPPEGAERLPIISALDLLEACKSEIPDADIVIYAAAVADWRPKHPRENKQQRSGNEPPVLELEENPDIAAETSGLGEGLKIGFALEQEENATVAREKLERKGLDVILLNTLEAMGSRENELVWIDRKGGPERSGKVSKREAAAWILRRAVAEIVDRFT